MRPAVLAKRSQDCRSVVLVWSDTRNAFLKGDRCVLLVDCPVCGARVGEPCKGAGGYMAGTHYPRRYRINPKLAPKLLRPLSRYRQRP